MNTNSTSLGEHLTGLFTGQRQFSGSEPMDLIGDTLGQYIGYNPIAQKWGLPTGTVVLIVSQIASKFAGKYANPQLNKIPIVGKYIKM